MQSFTEVIEAFGGVVPFRNAMGLPDVNARQMKLRDSIPAGYWPRVVALAQERGIEGVDLETLARLAQEKLEDSRRKAAAS